MDALENMIAPDAIGVEKGRYVWNGTRHHVKNHLLALLSIAGIIGLFAVDGFSGPYRPLSQMVLAVLIAATAYYLIWAIYDQSMRHVKYLALVGDKGFSIIKFNEENEEVLLSYVQPYNTLERIEKRQRYDVSEDGVYLQTKCRYGFYAPDKKFEQYLTFNRYDVRLTEREGLPDVKAMKAIEEAYAQSKKAASISRIMESEEVIPSRPQPLLRIKKPIMWADLRE